MNVDPEKSIMIGNKFKEDALGAVKCRNECTFVNSDVTEEDRKYTSEKS